MTQQQKQGVVASPNPRLAESERVRPVEGEQEATKLQPSSAVKSKPLGKKSKGKAATKKPRRD
ncbi:MAG TPA: hypothetical protein VFS10_07080 [Pyrinomonadaceae bacterium]|nr:hypothetical protein [Pyrinomonadaceae bacterium]